MDAAPPESELLLWFMTRIDEINRINPNFGWEISAQEDLDHKRPPSIHYSCKAVGVNETWQQHLTSIAQEAGLVCVWRGGLFRLHKLIQEPWESRRESSAVITCGSLLSESTSRLCVYFSLFPRGTELLEEERPPHTHEHDCNHEDRMMASLFVFACFLEP